MKCTKLLVLICILFLTVGCKKETANPIMHSMVERLIPQHADKFLFETLPADSLGDRFELESQGDKIVIRGNNENSMAVGLNHYLKYYCMTTVSWFLDDPVEVPEILPTVSEKVSISARAKNRFFLNYCTFGYTMPWWKWQDWERFIDWMALNGVNLPLATTGQEAIWHKVWTDLGLTDEEVRSYFTGPPYLPWHRMANVDYWRGPLPKEWLDNQVELQKQIVAREREFNMKPILPAFAGHVPKELKRIYPDAKITRMSKWGGFSEEYRASFLNPMDSLYSVIQEKYLTEQTRLFGTDHIYGVDPFNEVEPPSWEPDSLALVSKHIYESVTKVDQKATWLQMTWLFYFAQDKWTNPRIEAFLKSVPQDKMLLLDYFCEKTEVWKKTESYFGQPYIWCYLGNFGGNTMLDGNMKEVGERIENVFKNGGQNLWGLGSTLEALDVNPCMYEYVLEKAWDTKTSDSEWVSRLADRHVGKNDNQAREAWSTMYNKIYTIPAMLGHAALVNARPTLTGHGNWTTNPVIGYDNNDLLKVWKALVSVDNCTRNSYIFDVVNVGRQVLGNHFLTLRDQFTAAYNSKDIEALKIKGQEMQDLLAGLDQLLSCHRTFSLDRWITDARSFGHDEASKKYYESNARNIITTWGGKNDLEDYANRSLAGLTSSYYAPRWKMFIEDVTKALEERKTFDEKAYFEKMTQHEQEWTNSFMPYQVQTGGDAVKISKELINKFFK